jgi:hypothetical protein
MDLLGILEGIAKSPEGEQKLKGTQSPDDVVSLVKEHGMDIVVEEVHKVHGMDIVVEEVHKVLATKGGTGGLIDHLIEGIGGSGGKGGGEGIIEELIEGVVSKGETGGGKAGGEGIIEELLEGEGGAGGLLGKLLK